MLDAEILMTGLQLGESPRWHDERLWLSDWGAQTILAVDLAGRSETIAHVQAFPFSIAFDANGQLFVVAMSRVLRRAADGTLVPHADLGALSTRPWNEIVIDGSGNAYVNNIGFDFPGGEFAPGIVALVRPDGTVRQVADGVAFPNGMAITADNRTLILAESYGNCLTAFDIAADGSLSNRRVWAAMPDAYPDGICLDAEGAIWFADVPNRSCTRVRQGGTVLDRVSIDRGCFACMLGGPDGRTLFLVANEWNGPDQIGEAAGTGRVLTVRAPAPAAGWP